MQDDLGKHCKTSCIYLSSAALASIPGIRKVVKAKCCLTNYLALLQIICFLRFSGRHAFSTNFHRILISWHCWGNYSRLLNYFENLLCKRNLDFEISQVVYKNLKKLLFSLLNSCHCFQLIMKTMLFWGFWRVLQTEIASCLSSVVYLLEC